MLARDQYLGYYSSPWYTIILYRSLRGGLGIRKGIFQTINPHLQVYVIPQKLDPFAGFVSVTMEPTLAELHRFKQSL